MLQVRWGKWTWIFWDWRKYFSLSSDPLTNYVKKPYFLSLFACLMVLQMLWEEVWAAVEVGCYEIKQASKHLPLCFLPLSTPQSCSRRGLAAEGCHWSGFPSRTAWPLSTWCSGWVHRRNDQGMTTEPQNSGAPLVGRLSGLRPPPFSPFKSMF